MRKMKSIFIQKEEAPELANVWQKIADDIKRGKSEIKFDKGSSRNN